MTDYNWKDAVSGVWSAPDRWDPAGGPKINTLDEAIFATGSSSPYVVSGTGYAHDLIVKGDHVIFRDASIGIAENSDVGGMMDVTNGAVVRVAHGSTITAGSFTSLSVSNARMVVNGTVGGVILAVGQGGLLAVSGSDASLSLESQRSFIVGSVVSSGGTLAVSGGAKVSASTFSGIAGTVRLTGAGTTFTNEGAYLDTIQKGGMIVGSDDATLAGEATNSGVVEARDGVFHVTASVTGAGQFQIDRGATLDLGASSAEDVAFINHATLRLESGVAETGFLRGFGCGDAVDLVGTHVTSLSTLLSGGHTLLTAYEGTTVTSTLNFDGYYTPDNFAIRGTATDTLLVFQHAVLPALHNTAAA